MVDFFKMATGKTKEELIRPEILALRARGAVTWEEFDAPMNSYERDELLPVLTDEAFMRHFVYCASQVGYTGPHSYNYAVATQLAPEALKRGIGVPRDAYPGSTLPKNPDAEARAEFLALYLRSMVQLAPAGADDGRALWVNLSEVVRERWRHFAAAVLSFTDRMSEERWGFRPPKSRDEQAVVEMMDRARSKVAGGYRPLEAADRGGERRRPTEPLLDMSVEAVVARKREAGTLVDPRTCEHLSAYRYGHGPCRLCGAMPEKPKTFSVPMVDPPALEAYNQLDAKVTGKMFDAIRGVVPEPGETACLEVTGETVIASAEHEPPCCLRRGVAHHVSCQRVMVGDRVWWAMDDSLQHTFEAAYEPKPKDNEVICYECEGQGGFDPDAIPAAPVVCIECQGRGVVTKEQVAAKQARAEAFWTDYAASLCSYCGAINGVLPTGECRECGHQQRKPG